jgi:hypothetical protein
MPEGVEGVADGGFRASANCLAISNSAKITASFPREKIASACERSRVGPKDIPLGNADIVMSLCIIHRHKQFPVFPQDQSQKTILLLILLYCLLTADPDAGGGTVTGTVVNASSGKTPVSGAEVVLRAEIHGESMICGQTVTDRQGRFIFDNLPRCEQYFYLPGANRDGVHFSGPRLQLTPQIPLADVELSVFDSISAPCPLVFLRQDIYMRFRSGALSVTESIIVDNPTRRCYVGARSQDGGEPITMQLAIPPNFERTTFQMEFFGRRFFLLGDKLVTSVPWPPGQREIEFTYVMPVRQGYYLWQRPLDLPCEQLSLSIETPNVADISCNLAISSAPTPDKVVYQSHRTTLPKGHVVRIELSCLPVPFMTYARWLAAALLLVSFCIGGGLIFKQLYHSDNHRPRIDTQKCNIASTKTSRQDRRNKKAA